MELQRILDTIDKEFKGKAEVEYNEFEIGCVYKTGDGEKCAIGLFIPEGHEGQSYEGGVKSLLMNYPDLKKFMPSQIILDLQAFQRCHDGLSGTMTLEEQKTELKEKAKELFK